MRQNSVNCVENFRKINQTAKISTHQRCHAARVFVTLHVSCVAYQVSLVGCLVSHVTYLLQKKITGQSFEASQWRVCSQRAVPRLVNRPCLAGAVLQTHLLLIN